MTDEALAHRASAGKTGETIDRAPPTSTAGEDQNPNTHIGSFDHQQGRAWRRPRHGRLGAASQNGLAPTWHLSACPASDLGGVFRRAVRRRGRSDGLLSRPPVHQTRGQSTLAEPLKRTGIGSASGGRTRT
jgi:hypothetical protein